MTWDLTKRGALAALLLTMGFASSRIPAMGAEANWLVDFEQAKALAKKEGKDVLMDFTGSDWCGFCIELDKKVFSKEIFAEKIPESFILLKVDNPRDKSKQSDAEKKMVQELIRKYSISGFPTILLADAEGRPYASLVGYGGTPAEKYVEDLLAKQKTRIKRDEFLAKAESASGAERAKLLDQAIADIDIELAMNVYGDVIDQIIESDADNEAGLKKKYASLRADVQFKKDVEELANSVRRGKPREEVLAKLEAMVKEAETKKISGEARQEALFMMAAMNFPADKPKAKSLLQQAVKAAPDGPLTARIQMILKQAFPPEQEPKGDSEQATKKGGN